jgi:hypothetical protein
MDLFEFEQLSLYLQPVAKATQAAIVFDDPVARENEGQWI